MIRTRARAPHLLFCSVEPIFTAHKQAAAALYDAYYASFKLVDRPTNTSAATAELVRRARQYGCEPELRHPHIRAIQGKFGPGYRAMCAFWYADLPESPCVAKYDKLLRVDADCYIPFPSSPPAPPPSSPPPPSSRAATESRPLLASPLTFGMDDIEVISGMAAFFASLANGGEAATRHGWSWSTGGTKAVWASPYTNFLYM